MEGLPAASTKPSIMGRAQKIRKRMALEMTSGISVADKDGFLRVCFQYERDAFEHSLPVCDRVYRRSYDIENIQNSSYGDWQRFDDWDDWTDWHKILHRSGKLQ